MGEVYLNGNFMPLEEARVPVMDRGFLFGDGVYEVIPVYRGRTFRLTQHMERLDNSLCSIRMENPRQRGAWEGIFERLIAAVPEADQLIYLQVTRGVDPARNHLFPRGGEPTVFVMAWTAKRRDPKIAEQGIAAISLDGRQK
jgi:D-alanine transaminase